MLSVKKLLRKVLNGITPSYTCNNAGGEYTLLKLHIEWGYANITIFTLGAQGTSSGSSGTRATVWISVGILE